MLTTAFSRVSTKKAMLSFIRLIPFWQYRFRPDKIHYGYYEPYNT